MFSCSPVNVNNFSAKKLKSANVVTIKFWRQSRFAFMRLISNLKEKKVLATFRIVKKWFSSLPSTEVNLLNCKRHEYIGNFGRIRISEFEGFGSFRRLETSYSKPRTPPVSVSRYRVIYVRQKKILNIYFNVIALYAGTEASLRIIDFWTYLTPPSYIFKS